MPGEIWRSEVRVAKEVTAGLAVSPATRKLYFMNPGLTEAIEVTANEFATGTRDNVRSISLGSSQVGGAGEFPMSADEIVEALLISMAGGVTPTTPTGATNGRLWTFTPSVNLDSMTMEWFDGVRSWQGAGVQGNQLTIAGNVRSRNTVSLDLFAQAINALGGLSGSPADRTPSIIQGYETRAYIDAAGIAPGSSMIPGQLVNWNVRMNNQLGREYTADNTRNANNINTGTLQIEGATFLMRGVPASVANEIANWRAGTLRTIRLEFGTNDAISGETPVNEVQTLTLTGTPTGGTIVVSVLGVNTATIAFNASAAAVATAYQNAINAIPSMVGTIVTGSGGPLPAAVTLTFSGTAAGMDLPVPLLVTNSLTGGSTPSATFGTTTPGYSGKRYVTVDLPAAWTAVNRGQTNEGARAVEFTARYVYDPVLAAGIKIRAQNARTAAW